MWVKRGTKRRDLEFWKGIVGKKGDKKEGFGVLEGDCGSWKGQVLGPGRGALWVLEGVDFGSWKGWILGMVSVSS